MGTSRMSRSLGCRSSRRGFVAGSAALAATPLIGSRAFAQDATPATPASGASPVAAQGNGEPQLEIFSWWTTAGEAAGLDQIFQAFAANNPNVEIVNAAVAGGAGSNAQAALQTRLSANQPPDSWQSHTGAELRARYVEPGYTETVTDLYAEQGWSDVFPQGVLDQVTLDGEQYLVPVGVHRGNGMFYNRQVLADNGVEVADDWTLDDYFAAAETLQAAGVPSLGLGSKDTFAVLQLFENTLLGALGPDDYTAIWTGGIGWDDERVTGAIESLARFFESVNENHPTLTWDGAMDEVYAGRAAFSSMGDWAYGDAVTKEVQDTVGWVNHPGTAGSFVSVIDGFTLPVGAPHPINARNWLITAGSAEAQLAFAPFKGALPARGDADVSTLNEYLQWASASFTADAIVPSLAHGSAASPQFSVSAGDAIVSFVVDQDVATFQEALQFAQEDEQ